MPQQQQSTPLLLRRASSDAGSFVQRLPWESWEHPANIPLHPPAHHRYERLDAADEQDEQPPRSDAQLMLRECRHILFIAGPLFIEGVAAIGQQLVASSCVGHLNDNTALSALILGQSLYNVTGYSLLSGLASALETLCGQAFGAGNLHMMSATLIRAQLVCAVAVLPTLLLWGSGSLAHWLPALGQQPEIAAPASRLLFYLSPALGLAVVSETVAQYLLAQSKALPIAVSSLVGLGLAPLLYWGFVMGLDLGLTGAAWAAVSIQSTLVVLLMSYLVFSECTSRSTRTAKGWQGIRVGEVLQGWLAYLQFGLPCVLMVCLEWWMWEVVVLMAGLLAEADVAVAVTGLATQLQAIPWILCYALGTATATRIAQSLGAGDARRAARLYRTSCLLVLVCSVAMCAGMWLGKSYLAAALTSSRVVQQQLQEVLPYVVATIILDGQAAVLSGVLRGTGRQGVGAATSVCSYWLVGLPLAWFLAFRVQLGVLGLRLSLAAAVAVQALVLHVFTALRVDWHAEVERARELVAADTQGNGGGGGQQQVVVADEACAVDRGLLGAGSGLLGAPAGAQEQGSGGSAGRSSSPAGAGAGSSSLQRPLLLGGELA